MSALRSGAGSIVMVLWREQQKACRGAPDAQSVHPKSVVEGSRNAI